MSDPPGERNMVERLGAGAIGGLERIGGMSLLLGQTLDWTRRGLFTRRVRLDWRALAGQIVRVGSRSLWIVILVQIFIGMIIALQMTPPLRPWGQEQQVSPILGVAGFRMLGPIITAVVLSGFAGASIAAELGTMVVSEEIEAMRAMALNPVRFLVVPRVLATLIMTVTLSAVADVMIALGGWITSRAALGPEVYMGYWDRMRDMLTYLDFVTGLIMAGVFGLLIGLIACYEGLQVTGGAAGVGRATTMTVVYSIVAIVLSAAVFTAVFYAFGL